MGFSIILWLAEIVGPDIGAFEQRLQGQVHFIIWMYGIVFVVGLGLLIAFTLHIQGKPLSCNERTVDGLQRWHRAEC